jgi:threonine aldolase
MLFRSDNITGVSPEIFAAIQAADEGDAAAYGNDDYTARLGPAFSAYFETEVIAHPVATGIAANALALATAMPPPAACLCHAQSHVFATESGAPEFFAGGGKLIALPGRHGKLWPEDVARTLAAQDPARLQAPPISVVSITQGAEAGTVYTLDHISELGAICRRHGVALHMDGARFSNAFVSLGCSPAEMSWRAGVDILSYGATKNGAMCADAVLIFKASPHAAALDRWLGHRRLRAGQVFSKMRYISAQLLAMLEGGLAARNASHANAMAQRLSLGLARLPGVELVEATDINEVFVRLPDAVRAGLASGGFPVKGRPEDPGLVRFVTGWNSRVADIDAFVAAAASGVAAAA